MGVAQTVGNVRLQDTQQAPFAMGRHGEQLAGEIHGKRFVSRIMGNGFSANFNGNTGVSIIAPGQTTAGAVLYNPAGSGVNVELERIVITTASAATVVVAGLGLEGSVQVPSSVTAATTNTFPLGAGVGTAKALAYKTATIVAMTYIMGLGLSFAATTSVNPVSVWDSDGGFTMAPGFAINLVSSITQATAKLIVDFFWSEWPV